VSTFWSNMTATVNFGPHTHLEFSGPSNELIKIFLKLSKFVKKIGLHLHDDFLEIDLIFKIFTPH